MKGKYARKKSRKIAPALIIVLFLMVVAMVAGVWILFGQDKQPAQQPSVESGTVPTEPTTETKNEAEGTDVPSTEEPDTEATEPDSEATAPEVMEDIPTSFDLGNGLEVSGFGDYTGMYMEDGSNEIVSKVMMIMVTNNSTLPLQYAEITLSGRAGDARFTLSTLNPGQTAIVLEVDRKSYITGDSYTEASIDKVAFFDGPLNTYSDILKIQPLDGGFNITNISDKDIVGDIIVYYKNYAGDLLYGGITYRGTITGGLAAGQIKQVMSSTFTESGTAVMFVSISEN